MSIDCENPTDCNNVIMFQDRVQKMGGSLGVPNLDIKDIEADKHKVLVQTTDEIYVLNTGVPFDVNARVDLQFDKRLNCQAITIHKWGHLSASICSDTESSVGYIILVSYLTSDPFILAYE